VPCEYDCVGWNQCSPMDGDVVHMEQDCEEQNQLCCETDGDTEEPVACEYDCVPWGDCDEGDGDVRHNEQTCETGGQVCCDQAAK